MSPSIHLEDRDWNMERFENGMDQAPLLPRTVIGASQGDENVVSREPTDRVLECRERGLVADLGRNLGFRGEGFDVAEDDGETLVRLVSRSVGVRGEPTQPATSSES